ncbi:hypothetical protein NUM3379_34660 [Kineococcus sp. NUM-3379]
MSTDRPPRARAGLVALALTAALTPALWAPTATAAPGPDRASAGLTAKPFPGSIWYTPIGSGAKFVPAGIERTTKHRGEITVDEEIISVDPSDPVRKLNGSIPVHVDPSLQHNGKWNGCATFLRADKPDTVISGQPLRLSPGGDPSWQYTTGDSLSLRGDGIEGCHGGSHMSGIGGTIRKGDLSRASLDHALKINLWCKKHCSLAEGGKRWPARTADSYASRGYGGKVSAVRMGSLLALKPDADLSFIRSENARKIAEALRDYGGYLVDDTAWDVHALSVERGAEFSDGGTFHEDLQRVFTMLHVVDNNAPGRIGGGGEPSTGKPAPSASPTPSASPKPSASPTPSSSSSPKPSASPTPSGDRDDDEGTVLPQPPGEDASEEEKLNWLQRAWLILFGDDEPTKGGDEESPREEPTPTASPTPSSTSSPQASPKASPKTAPAGTVRVMPLGDSLTDGFPVDGRCGDTSTHRAEQGSYRGDLAKSFPAGRIRYVGSLTNGPADMPGGRAHEGRCGWWLAEHPKGEDLASHAGDWVRTHTPDVVLLHAGTNDLIHGASPAEAAQRLGTVLDQIHAARPQTTVLVASLAPMYVDVSAFNALVPDVVADRASKGAQVRFVDMAPADLDKEADYQQGQHVHPDASGYTKMAAAWRPVLEQVLTAPSPATARP